MEILHYPLLCWKLDGRNVCGHLVGLDCEAVGGSVKKVINYLSDWLQKQMKSGWEPSALENPALKVLKVKIRPSYSGKKGFYPAPSTLEIPAPAVHGLGPSGSYECYLPSLGIHFYYYDKEQLEELIHHFTKDSFSRMKPEEIHRHLLPSRPWLEKISIKKKSSQPRGFREGESWESFRSLPALGERFPLSKSQRRTLQIAPEVLWEQGEKVEEVMDKILKEKVSFVLVGERSVGKSAILLEAIRKSHQILKSRSSSWKPYFWRSSPHRIVAGARYLGEWQQICEEMLEELEATKGILWLMDFVSLFYVGGEGVEDSIAAFMLPYIQKGRIQVIGELTPQELQSARNLYPSFMQNFQLVNIKEMGQKKVFRLLGHFQNHCQKNFEIKIEQRALEVGYRILKRFFQYESFPGKAIRFFTHCVKEAHLQKMGEIGVDPIIQAFVEKTGMAELFLRDDITLDKEDLHQFFASRIKGQEEAIEKLCQVVKIFKAGLNNPEKPIATMLFVGPTGVGKTASVKALGEFFFGHGQKLHPLIRLDMSEFQFPGQIDRLIGSGGNNPGKLIQQIRERPFSVLLLDEIEKAHSSIFDALLGVLDEGRLIDAYGRVADFRNTIIIMTSNLGAGQKSLSGFEKGKKVDWEDTARSFFRPEFYNRLDMTILFHSLSSKSLLKITEKELEDLKSREGIQKRNLQLEFTPSLVEFLAREGSHPLFGARPLQRTIEREVVAPLSQFLLENLSVKDCILKMDYKKKKGVVIGISG